MDILNTKIKSILTEKTNKIRPENIKSGINILGIDGSYSGLDTSDATATASDIKTDKTAYVNGQKITGNFAGIVPSGTINILQNGTNIDVSQYASADVSVSGSGGKNVQANLGFYVTTQTIYKYTGLKIIVAKSGTYTIKWLCRRDGTSNTYGSALYKNGTLYGEENTTWAATYYLNGVAQSNTINTFQLTTLEHVQLTEGDELAIYTKSGSNGTWVYTHGLVIEEE